MISEQKVFRPQLFNAERIKEKVSHIGAACIGGFLFEDFLEALLEEAKAARYEVQPKYVKNVKQDLELCKLGEADEGARNRGAYDNIYALRDAYQRFLGKATSHWGFPSELKLNSIYLQRYRPSSFGISPHRDNPRFINLISIFTLSGNARFYLCNDKTGSSPHELDASPGSVILLRAPGLPGKSIERPDHYLSGPTESFRYSITLRQILKPV